MKRSRDARERDWRHIIIMRERKHAKKAMQMTFAVDLIERRRHNPCGTTMVVEGFLGEDVVDVVYSEGNVNRVGVVYCFKQLSFLGRGGKDLFSVIISSLGIAMDEPIATFTVRGAKTILDEFDWGPGLLDMVKWNVIAPPLFEAAPRASLPGWRLVCKDWRDRIDAAGFWWRELPEAYRSGSKVPWPLFALHRWFDPNYGGPVPRDISTLEDIVQHRAALQAPDAVDKLRKIGQGAWLCHDDKEVPVEMILKAGGFPEINGPPKEDDGTFWSVQHTFHVTFKTPRMNRTKAMSIGQIVMCLVHLATNRTTDGMIPRP